MKLLRFIGAASLAGGFLLATAGTAAADDVGLNTTGADSKQSVTIDNSVTVTQKNTNDVQVVNVNAQKAETGNVEANSNTTVGGLSSGNASNQNAADTSVSINNGEAVVPGQGNGGGNVPGAGNGGNGGTVSGSNGGNTPAPGKGSVLGASVGGLGAGAPAMLPETGASVPVDVSALRAAWHPQSAAITSPARKTSPFSVWMLLTAAVLSLMGAAGSVIQARRAERRV